MLVSGVQIHQDGLTHPIAFASKALAALEKNYSIANLKTLAVVWANLETLTVVWAVSHYYAHLYGHNVEVRTDHSAVKAVLGTPGKHVRWWTKVYSSGGHS